MIVEVEEREYARLLGYPWGTALVGEVRERAEQAVEWYRRQGNPRVYCASAVAAVYDRRFSLQATLNPAVIDRRYSGATVTAITSGHEVDTEIDSLWAQGRVDEAYFLDRYAAAVVEELASQLGPHRSPGTAGMPFEEQWTLFSFIVSLKPEIEILPSGMLKPKNSLLALVSSPGKFASNPCTRCDLAGCTFRRRSA
jgi:hypothetical protein